MVTISISLLSIYAIDYGDTFRNKLSLFLWIKGTKRSHIWKLLLYEATLQFIIMLTIKVLLLKFINKCILPKMKGS